MFYNNTEFVSSNTLQIDVSTTTETMQSLSNDISLYPNPVQEELIIINNGLSIKSIEVINITGDIQATIDPGLTTTYIINTNTGMLDYIIYASSQKTQFYQKIVKKIILRRSVWVNIVLPSKQHESDTNFLIKIL